MSTGQHPERPHVSIQARREAALRDGLRASLPNIIEHAEQNDMTNEELLEWVFAAGAEWQKLKGSAQPVVDQPGPESDPPAHHQA